MRSLETTRLADHTRRCRIIVGGAPVTFRELFDRLEADDEFSDWYSRELAATPYPAFFWEHPPLTTASLADEAEFVLVESGQLDGLAADPGPFGNKFERANGRDVIAFDNLGGDARLVVPTPIGSLDAYAHLAAFLRCAPAAQKRSLWKTMAGSLNERLSAKPSWLSTAGLGVSWLHLRIDTRPKYYRHDDYKRIG